MGAGGIGVVRLSGPGAVAAAAQVFRSTPPLDAVPSHTLHHGFLHLADGSILDEGVAAIFRAPRSYTGEDVVEISCHGGVLLPKRALELLLAAGARLAGPGEFTRRAFLNGKLDLAQAEAVADLVGARSESLRRLAFSQLRGALSRQIEALREKALGLLARLEANLDFAEEEVPDLGPESLRNHLKSLASEASELLDAGSRSRLLREGLSAVLVGAPNVGKSSLFNALLNEDRAIVAAEPGTTRDTLEETVVIAGLPVRLTDTAGRRETPEAVEAEGVARAQRALAGAGAAILVVDARCEPTEAERQLAREVGGTPAVLVVNKMDLAAAADAERWRGALGWKGPVVPTSAARGEGLEALGAALVAAAGGAQGPAGAEAAADAVYLNARQEERLRQAVAGFDRAVGAPEEAAALELRGALGALNELTGGANLSEEVLDAIFSRFCIGK